MIHGWKFIFIRFNPDEYVNQNGTKKNIPIKKRMEDLFHEINIQTERICMEENVDLLEVVYLFYDNYN